MYICIYVCMCVYVYIILYVYMYVCMYVYMCIYMYVYICVCVYVYICMCVCVYNIYIYIKGFSHNAMPHNSDNVYVWLMYVLPVQPLTPLVYI